MNTHSRSARPPRLALRSPLPLALCLFALGAGCSSAPPDSSIATASTVVNPASPHAPPPREEWRRGMSKSPLTEGCFRATYPDAEWSPVPCGPASIAKPMMPAKGLGAGEAPVRITAGGAASGDDTAGAPANIYWSEGSFPRVSGVALVSSNGESNAYSLQLNANIFAAPLALCPKGRAIRTCVGWQQFVYSDGQVFMQYWLVGYSGPCPTNWQAFQGSCFTNSGHLDVPTPDGADLGRLVLAGAAGSTDMVTFWTGDDNVYAVSQKSVLGLSGGWNTTEFNVFGDSGNEAFFNDGATVTVQTVVESLGGSTAAPTCPSQSFTQETSNLSFVGSCCQIAGAAPAIWFTESTDRNATATACPPSAPVQQGAYLAASPQFGVEQTDLFAIGPTGQLTVSWTANIEPWNEPWTIGSPIFQPGAPLAASQQFGVTQTDVFAVDTGGNLDVFWADGPGVWQGPYAIAGNFLPSTHVAASQQFGGDQTDVFAVDRLGALTVSWVDGPSVWHSQEITAQNLFVPGGPLAASQQFGLTQTDVFLVDATGTLDVIAAVGGGQWGVPYPISSRGQFRAGAPLAASQQFGANQTDVFVVNYEGELTVTSVVGAGAWQAPRIILPGNTLPFGANLTASQQFGVSQTDVFYVDASGVLEVVWVEGGTNAWLGPYGISGVNRFPNGGPIAAVEQAGTAAQLDVFAVDDNNQRGLASVVGPGAWQGPTEMP